MMHNLSLVSLACLCVAFSSPSLRAAEPIDFDRDVMPLLVRRCLECHNSSDHKGKLDLTSAKSVLKRDEPVIVTGKLDESLLWQRVHDDEMPPKKPLSAAEKQILSSWIQAGAKWGKTDPLDRYLLTTETHAGADWWSLLPVKRLALPQVKATDWVSNPIDAFILARLEAKGFAPSSPASREVLIRRLHFDLIGLPPTPAEIAAFVNDADPKAYEKLVDRLLASPRYGERWARHWLDVARYTESQGFEYDRLRANAWHYRDYVINAFNSDKPYDLFVKEQIAGDVKNFASPVSPVSREGIIATSLLVCGPWDQAGNSQANQTQRMLTREEELEDLVSVIGQSFLGLTINCARCHSHKFDPITQQDYYRFKAVFEGIRHGERTITPPNELAARQKIREELEASIRTAEQKLAALENKGREKALENRSSSGGKPDVKAVSLPQPLARWTFDGDARDTLGAMNGELLGGALIRNGKLILKGSGQHLRTAPLNQEVREKTLEAWLTLPTLAQGGGGAITLETASGATFDSIVFAERQPRKWMAGSNFFHRTRDLNAEPEASDANQPIHIVAVYHADNRIALYRNGKKYGEAYQQGTLLTYKAGDARVLMGLRHSGTANGYLQAEIDAAALYPRALTEAEIAATHAAGPAGGPVIPLSDILAELSGSQRRQHQALQQGIEETRTKLKVLPTPEISYVGTRQQPAPTRRFLRGDVTAPAEAVSPAGIAIISTPQSDFGLTPDAVEADRRIRLAEWMADPRHPLTARVMVNRIWHYHFGRGIVETTSDFGFNGVRPSHPELLDWLAHEFVHGTPAWSIKRMHRLILLSSTYRQGSQFQTRHAEQDSDNTLLWRYAPRRLEGEIIRDAMLTVSGQLNPRMGGPSFQPFTISRHGSDFYHLEDRFGPDYDRRTIYRMHVNSGKSPLLEALDCPDPSTKTPTRRVTTTPLAALGLMNNSFVLRQARAMADRVMKESKQNELQAIDLAFRIALGRSATKTEQHESAELVRTQGIASLCWALLNSSEFLYVK